MKNFSPRFTTSFFASSILFLVFSTSLLGGRGGKFPGGFEEAQEEKKQQEHLKEQQRERAREATAPGNSYSSLEGRGTARLEVVENQTADPAQEAVVEELLSKPDENIENQLRDPEVSKKFLERMTYYQGRARSAAEEEHSNDSLRQVSFLLEELSKQMNQVTATGDYNKFLKEIRFAESLYDFFEREKGQSPQVNSAAIIAATAGADLAVDPADVNHQRMAQSIASLVKLHDDQSVALNAIRADLIAAYQKRLMLMRLAPKNIDFSRPEKEQATVRRIFKLVDLALQTFHQGETRALDFVTPVIKQHQGWLKICRKNSLNAPTAYSAAREEANHLLCHAEGLAVMNKMNADRAIEDEVVASLPWDFNASFENNFTTLQQKLSQTSTTMESLKKKALAKVQSLLKVPAESYPQPSPQGRSSQFVSALDPALAGTQEAALVKLGETLFRQRLFQKANNAIATLTSVLSREMIAIDLQERSVLFTLISSQYQQMKNSNRRNEREKLLAEVKQTALLYPYIERKVGLLRQMMGVAPNAMPLEYFSNVAPLWDSMDSQWRKVIDSLDNLAMSRLLFEKKIAENPNDLFLRNALNDVRAHQEAEFQSLLEQAKQASPLPRPQTVNSRSSLNRLGNDLNETQRNRMFSLNRINAVFNVTMLSLAAYLLWLYMNNQL